MLLYKLDIFIFIQFILSICQQCFTVQRKEGSQKHNMERLNQFLESSSIHGLNHIATTKTFFRLFWVVTVTLGFILAGVLISKSFQRPVSSQHTFDSLGIFRILITNSNVY